MLIGGGGVDGAIHRKAGDKLLKECEKIKIINGVRCPFGEARITSAGNLNAKYVIHAVGPVYDDMKENADELLKSTYKYTLNLARENNCKKIAIPAISCGIFKFPIKKAARIAVDTCSLYDDLEITFYLRNNEAFQAWKNAINEEVSLEDNPTIITKIKNTFLKIFPIDYMKQERY